MALLTTGGVGGSGGKRWRQKPVRSPTGKQVVSHQEVLVWAGPASRNQGLFNPRAEKIRGLVYFRDLTDFSRRTGESPWWASIRTGFPVLPAGLRRLRSINGRWRPREGAFFMKKNGTDGAFSPEWSPRATLGLFSACLGNLFIPAWGEKAGPRVHDLVARRTALWNSRGKLRTGPLTGGSPSWRSPTARRVVFIASGATRNTRGCGIPDMEDGLFGQGATRDH